MDGLFQGKSQCKMDDFGGIPISKNLQMVFLSDFFLGFGKLMGFAFNQRDFPVPRCGDHHRIGTTGVAESFDSYYICLIITNLIFDDIC